jgi:arsenite methyltransferase
MAIADVYQTVNTHYSALARSTSDNIAEHSQKVALSFGYDADELAAIPEGANLGVSCGNPLAVAALRAVSIIGMGVSFRETAGIGE